MFEDSTFESTGRIRTRSRGWMFAALALNSTILLALVLVPLIYPEALPRQAMLFLMEIPPPAASTPPSTPHPVQHPSTSPATDAPNPFTAPTHIPIGIVRTPDAGPAPTGPIGAIPTGSSDPFGIGDAFHPQPQARVLPPQPKASVLLTSSIAAGLLIHKVIPNYPSLAKAMHIQGTVILAATIGKDGAIANLRVLSGPAVLQESALDAVSQWRYRPYLLNDQPVEVETTVNVIFTLAN